MGRRSGWEDKPIVIERGQQEREGEGGEGFYIAQTGKPADLHVSGGYLDNFCLDLSGMFPVLIEMLQDLGMQKAETNAKPLGRHCMCSFLGSFTLLFSVCGS